MEVFSKSVQSHEHMYVYLNVKNRECVKVTWP